MILEEIESKLLEVDPLVFYGKVDDSKVTDEWNYIVFMRKVLSIGEQKKEYSDRFIVAVIRENFIPEGIDTTVIDKMCEIPGMRVAKSDCPYTYTQKPGTNTVVEVLTMEFVRARKRVGA